VVVHNDADHTGVDEREVCVITGLSRPVLEYDAHTHVMEATDREGHNVRLIHDTPENDLLQKRRRVGNIPGVVAMDEARRHLAAEQDRGADIDRLDRSSAAQDAQHLAIVAAVCDAMMDLRDHGRVEYISNRCARNVQTKLSKAVRGAGGAEDRLVAAISSARRQSKRRMAARQIRIQAERAAITGADIQLMRDIITARSSILWPVRVDSCDHTRGRCF
jgi:hypothetical protein